MVSLLLNYNPNIPEPCSSSTDEIINPLQVACYYGHTEVAELLIISGSYKNIHTVFIVNIRIPETPSRHLTVKNKGITVFKIFISGGKSSDIRSDI